MIRDKTLIKPVVEGSGLEAGETQYTLDLIPTADQETPQVTYVNYDKAKTRVITYSFGEGYPGIEVANRAAARQHCRKAYGEILDEAFVPGRAFLRVRKA